MPDMPKKLANLNTMGSQKADIDKNNWVVNLSTKPLLPEERSLLEKGPKFVPTPTIIPHKDIVAEIEAAIRHLPDDSKDAVRTSSAAVLHRARLPAHNNVSKEERKALNNLKKDQSRRPTRGIVLLSWIDLTMTTRWKPYSTTDPPMK